MIYCIKLIDGKIPTNANCWNCGTRLFKSYSIVMANINKLNIQY